jgi:hypothetical protein
MGRDQGFMTFTHRGSNTTTSVSYWASTAHWQGPNSRIEHFEVAASRRSYSARSVVAARVG